VKRINKWTSKNSTAYVAGVLADDVRAGAEPAVDLNELLHPREEVPTDPDLLDEGLPVLLVELHWIGGNPIRRSQVHTGMSDEAFGRHCCCWWRDLLLQL
jgi:hypothetical protein